MLLNDKEEHGRLSGALQRHLVIEYQRRKAMKEKRQRQVTLCLLHSCCPTLGFCSSLPVSRHLVVMDGPNPHLRHLHHPRQ